MRAWQSRFATLLSLPRRLQIDNSLARLGEQRAALENLSAQAEVINALKVGADASKGAMKVRGGSGSDCWRVVCCARSTDGSRCMLGAAATCPACWLCLLCDVCTLNPVLSC